MSTDKVISDVQIMLEKYKLKTLMINDDNFLIDKVRAKEILNKLIALKLTLVFPSLLHYLGILTRKLLFCCAGQV